MYFTKNAKIAEGKEAEDEEKSKFDNYDYTKKKKKIQTNLWCMY